MLGLALAAGALAATAPAASAETCYGVDVGGTSAYVCNERDEWDERRWYATCTVDAPGSKFDAVCTKIVIVEYPG